MRKTELTRFKKLLLERKKEILANLGDVMKDHVGVTTKEATGDLSSYSYHMADQGTDAMEKEMAFMLASKSGRFVYHIDEALRRIEDGSYGRCVVCNDWISKDRLVAVPHARLCIECKSAEEDKRTGK